MERVRKESKLDEMERALIIDDDDLHTDLLHQPQLYWMVSKEVALAVSRRDAAEKDLETTEARCDLNIRRGAREKKLDTTEKEIKSQVAMHLDMEKGYKEVSRLELEVAQWKAMERAFGQRMDALKKLVDLYLKNYWQESGLSGSADSMKSYNASLARRDMNARRRST